MKQPQPSTKPHLSHYAGHKSQSKTAGKNNPNFKVATKKKAKPFSVAKKSGDM